MDTSIFKQIGSNSSKLYFIYDLSTRKFTYLNKSAESIFEGSWQWLLQEQTSLPDVVHPEDRLPVFDCINKLLQGKTIQTEFRLQLSGYPDKTISAEASPVYDEAGTLISVAGIAEDITERVQYTAYLVEFGRKKNSALEILAHDLRGPLSMVQTIAQSLETDHQKQNYSEITNYTHFIGKACVTCINLIVDILSEEHLKSPTIAVKLERVDMVEKVKEVMDLYAINKSLSHSFVLHASQKVFACVDIVKLDQILNNLISNSIKFTQPDGTISITIKQEEKSVLLKHTDNGIGVPNELQPFLFEKYSRSARTGLHGEKTRGIGLSIVKDLVELQNGEVWCESEENIGTTIFIRLPLAE